MTPIRRGKDGEPVPDEENVLRLGIPSMDFAEHGRASPTWFELSTEDKKRIPPRLSVFCESLTTPRQAWELQGSREAYTAVARLKVEVIRAIHQCRIPQKFLRWMQCEMTAVRRAPGQKDKHDRRHRNVEGVDR